MDEGENVGRRRLETKALVLGYAMSRLDERYLNLLRHRTWSGAFEKAGTVLNLPPASFKNLRDEFDPLHSNPRQGWHKRALRPTRQRVVSELRELSDEAVAEMVRRILNRDDDPIILAIDSLSRSGGATQNVAERLLTGRRAEEYFIEHSHCLVGVRREDLLDRRNAASGYDFGVKDRGQFAIEVKGLKPFRGTILFTDREWTEARLRQSDYVVVIVGGLGSTPKSIVVADPCRNLEATCTVRTSIRACWNAPVAVE